MCYIVNSPRWQWGKKSKCDVDSYEHAVSIVRVEYSLNTLTLSFDIIAEIISQQLTVLLIEQCKDVRVYYEEMQSAIAQRLGHYISWDWRRIQALTHTNRFAKSFAKWASRCWDVVNKILRNGGGRTEFQTPLTRPSSIASRSSATEHFHAGSSVDKIKDVK
jgi:hypothetical protein